MPRRTSNRPHHLAAAAAVTIAVAASPIARADLPPPDGRKYVSYAFEVTGQSAFKDHVLLAFPWSLSGGRPTEEHTVVEDGKPVQVGRRSGAPKLYSMRRSDYDAFMADYKPPEDNYNDLALRALFTDPKVHPCDVAPTVVHELDDDDDRSQVLEVMRVVAIDDAKCDLEITKASTPSGSGIDASTRTKVGGCAGCSAQGGDSSLRAALVLAGALVLSALRLRTGRRSRGPRAGRAAP